MSHSTYPHKVMRVTVNAKRDQAVRARVRCECGRLFYGRDRLGALDAWTPHVITSRQAQAFAVVGAQA